MFQALDAPKIVNKINQNTQALVHFLEKNKNIESLYWSRSEKSKKNFDSFSKDSDSVGGLITLSVKNISLKKFYDKIKILKSPSFGTYFSLICPFMYLAHYDLVNNPEGRAYLKNLGIDPDLIRVSVGSEKIEEILAIFKEALE
jgi:cystathionine gamma-synthase